MMKVLSTWPNPFRREVDELFPFFGDWDRAGMPGRALPTEYVPPIDSAIDGTTFRIKADLPGVDPTKIELTVKDDQLTLKGERKTEQAQQNGTRLQQEVRYGSFARTFPLPEGVRVEEVQARSHDGVLEVTVPLPAAKRPKRVPVQIEGAERQSIAS